jgi:hypothetical protein
MYVCVCVCVCVCVFQSDRARLPHILLEDRGHEKTIIFHSHAVMFFVFPFSAVLISGTNIVHMRDCVIVNDVIIKILRIFVCG